MKGERVVPYIYTVLDTHNKKRYIVTSVSYTHLTLPTNREV